MLAVLSGHFYTGIVLYSENPVLIVCRSIVAEPDGILPLAEVIKITIFA